MLSHQKPPEREVASTPSFRPGSRAMNRALHELPRGRYAAEDRWGIVRIVQIERGAKGSKFEGWVFVQSRGSVPPHAWREAGRARKNGGYVGDLIEVLANVCSDPPAASERYTSTIWE